MTTSVLIFFNHWTAGVTTVYIAKYKGPLRKIKGRSPKCNKVTENALRTQEIIITMTGEFMYLTLF